MDIGKICLIHSSTQITHLAIVAVKRQHYRDMHQGKRRRRRRRRWRRWCRIRERDEEGEESETSKKKKRRKKN